MLDELSCFLTNTVLGDRVGGDLVKVLLALLLTLVVVLAMSDSLVITLGCVLFSSGRITLPSSEPDSKQDGHRQGNLKADTSEEKNDPKFFSLFQLPTQNKDSMAPWGLFGQ